MNTVTTIGLDIAKHVIQVQAVDRRSKPVLRKTLKRHQVLAFFANLPPCLIGTRPAAALMTGRGAWRPWAIR